MTYCVGLLLEEGMVMLADTRTNAGLDNISTFAKLHVFHNPGERMIAVMTAGNLAVSQSVLNLVQEGLPDPEAEKACRETIRSVPSMFHAAALVGEAVRHVHKVHGEAMRKQDVRFDVSVLVGGQIGNEPLRLFHVYAAGNFIEATRDTPFLQVGEHKYGKPILDRAVRPDMPLADAVKLVLISMDSTLRSNLSVGLPLDLLVYRRNQLDHAHVRRIGEHDPYFQMIRERWSTALREAHRAIPAPEWGF
jgi:putative proteasome-type protease